MVVFYWISDFGLWFVVVAVISYIALNIIPMGEELPACIFGIITIIAVIGIFIAGAMHANADYWAYRYDKVIANRENVIAACPDMSKYLCVEKYRAYQRDSVDACAKYMAEREE